MRVKRPFLRNFLLVLLLINLGILAWYHWLRESDESIPIAASYEGLPTLALADEPNVEEAGPQIFALMTGQELLNASVSECRSIGPFDKAGDADGATRNLRGLDYSVARHRAPGRVFVGFWVNVPPAADRAAAEVVADALRADGITDFYIVPSGDDQYAVSLGVFSELARAQRRSQQMSGRGFKIQVNQRFKDGEVIWLDVSGFGADSLDIAALGVDVRNLEILGDCPKR